MAELVRWRAGQHPDRVAVEHAGRETTYAELDRRASRVANALIRSGVQPGGRVCVLEQNHDHSFETIFGIAKAGAVYAPVNWRLAPQEMLQLIEDAKARVLLDAARTLLAWPRARLVAVRPRSRDLAFLAECATQGRLTPIVEHVFPLERIAEAEEQVATKHTRGKVIVRVP